MIRRIGDMIMKEIPASQAAYQSGRSTTEQVFVFWSMAEEAITSNDDNGPQYASQKFRQFTREWTVSHCFSSPHYPQSNGLAEIMVKAVKNHLKKSNHSKSDIYKSLLALHNTHLPVVNHRLSCCTTEHYEMIYQELPTILRRGQNR